MWVPEREGTESVAKSPTEVMVRAQMQITRTREVDIYYTTVSIKIHSYLLVITSTKLTNYVFLTFCKCCENVII